MKRLQNVLSPTTYSPKSRSKKRCKEETELVDVTLNTPEIKRNLNTERTGGGISKSLLTPCRRIGLARNRTNFVSTPVDKNKSPLTTKSLDSKTRTIQSSENDNSLENITSTKFNEDINMKNEIAYKTKSNEDQDLNMEAVENTVIQKYISTEINNDIVSEPMELKQSCMKLLNKTNELKSKSQVCDGDAKEVQRKSPGRARTLPIKNKVTSNCSISQLQNKEPSASVEQLTSQNNSDDIISSQKSTTSSSYISDDDDNHDFESKTIIERRSYKNSTKASSKLKINKSKKPNITEKNIEDIKQRIKEKREKLDMIKKINDTQGHSTEELEKLINSWRDGCKMALEELLNFGREMGQLKENTDMGELLKLLNIPCELVQYNPEQMAFE